MRKQEGTGGAITDGTKGGAPEATTPNVIVPPKPPKLG